MKINLRDERSRFYAIAIALFLIAGIFAGLFIFLSTRNDKNNNSDSNNNIKLTSDEKSQINKITSDFLKDSGNFGLKPNTVDGNNIMEVRYMLDVQQLNSMGTYYRSRFDSYADIRKKYLSDDSNLNYSNSVLSNWDDTIERTSMLNYNVQNISANIPEYGYTNTDESNGKSTFVDVTANTNSTSTIINQPVTDSSWNGIFNVNSKTFPNTIKITFKKQGNSWKVYDADTSSMQNPFTYSFLSDVDYTKYNDSFTGFNTVGHIDSHIKKK